MVIRRWVILFSACFYFVDIAVSYNVTTNGIPNASSPDLMFWLKADAIVGLNDGDKVPSWPDSSANSLEFTGGLLVDNPEDHLPIYKSNVINGFPVVRFDGDQWFVHELGAGVGTPPLTVFAVVTNIWTAGLGAPCAFAHSTNGFRQSNLGVTLSTIQVHSRRTQSGDGSNQISSMTHDALGGPFIAAGTFGNNPNFQVLEDHGEILPYFNGVPGDSPNNARSPIHDRISIGAYTRQAYANFGWKLTGDVAEVIVFNRLLSASELNDIGYYLAQKYNIASEYQEPALMFNGSPNPSYSYLRAWLKADAITGVQNGTPVDLWTDSSDKGNDFIGGFWGPEGNTHKPVYVFGGLNGHPIVRFSGNQWMMCAANSTESLLDSKTIIAVAKDVRNAATPMSSLGVLAEFTTDDYGYARASLKAGRYQATTHTRMGVHTHSISTIDYDDYAILAIGVFNDDGSHIAAANSNFSVEWSAGRDNVRENVMGIGAHTKQHLRYEMGSYESWGEFFNGDIAEILFFDKALNESEIFDVGRYLTRKYFLSTDYVIPIGTVEQTNGTTVVYEEGETSDTFYIVLTDSPSAGENVIVQVVPHYRASDIRINSQSPGNPTTLLFDSSNWDVPQEVTVTAVDDSLQQSMLFDFDRTAIVKFFIQSSDSNFSEGGIVPLEITIVDDDVEHWSMLPMDINEDTYIDLHDLAILALSWLDQYTQSDFSLLSSDWLRCTNPQEESCITPLVHLSSNGSGRATGYAFQNTIVRIDNKTHIAWQDSEGYWEVTPHEGNIFYTRIKTYCHDTYSWSPTYTVGEAYDNHGTPSLLADSEGYLHIIYYPHHHQFRYRRSLSPNNASEWTSESLIGGPEDRLTYPSAVRTMNDKILLVCRNRDSDNFFTLVLYEKELDQPWQGPTVLASGRLEQGYINYGSSLAMGENGETVHLSFHFMDSISGAYALGYMYSPDQGVTWKHADGSIAHLPVTPDTTDIIAGNPYPGGNVNVGNNNIAIDSENKPWMLHSHSSGWPYDTRIARLLPDGQWDIVSLLPFIQQRWPNMSITGGNMTFDENGILYVALTLITSPTGSSTFGIQTSEVILLVSKDMAQSFSIYRVSPWFNDRNDPDPRRFVPNWWPAIERPTSHERIRTPSLTFTHGVRGTDNKQILSNDVVWVNIEKMLGK